MRSARTSWAWTRLLLALVCGAALAAAPSVIGSAQLHAAGARAGVELAHVPASVGAAVLRAQLSLPTADTGKRGHVAPGGLLPLAAALVALGAVVVVRRGHLRTPSLAVAPRCARAPPADVTS